MAAVVSGCTLTQEHAAPPASAYVTEVSADLEEISVTRTTRTQYLPGTTPACDVAPFKSASEQHYDSWSVKLRSSDARMANTHVTRTGGFAACFGTIAPDGSFPMYAWGSQATVSYRALGECRFMHSKPPAAGLLVLNCRADFSGLPNRYIGGYLTTSSLAPSGGKSGLDVPGYLSTSIITMRLWKKTG
ncbi:MAG TPA: hypothetical protein VGV09_02410 [Steroidobacteraceae bacterium]|nr:hypothetical protein [Steroidobacteraceae bacterium]